MPLPGSFLTHILLLTLDQIFWCPAAISLLLLWLREASACNVTLAIKGKGTTNIELSCFLSRLLELLPHMHIPRCVGIATKCLSYAKASSDPFVYCLLRQQYRKVLVSVINRVLRKDHYPLSAYSTSSTLDTTDNIYITRITWRVCQSSDRSVSASFLQQQLKVRDL